MTESRRKRALRDTLVLARLGRRRVQRRRRQRVSRLRRHTTRSATAPVRHRRQPELSRAPSRAGRRRSPSEFGLQHEIIHTARARTARVPREPGEPLLLLQARALHASVARSPPSAARVVVDGNNADDRGDYRPGPPGRARVRRPQPARRSRSRRRTRSASCRARRPADVGRAGVGVPVVAHSVSHRSDRREAADDRARRTGAARARVPRLPRAASRRRSRASRSPATRWRARSSPEIGARHRARAEGGRLPLRDARPAGLPHGQPERGSSPHSRLTLRRARRRRRPTPDVARATADIFKRYCDRALTSYTRVDTVARV